MNQSLINYKIILTRTTSVQKDLFCKPHNNKTITTTAKQVKAAKLQVTTQGLHELHFSGKQSENSRCRNMAVQNTARTKRGSKGTLHTALCDRKREVKLFYHKNWLLCCWLYCHILDMFLSVRNKDRNTDPRWLNWSNNNRFQIKCINQVNPGWQRLTQHRIISWWALL